MEPTTTVMNLEWLSGATSSVVEITESVLSMITGNALFALLFAASTIIPLGLRTIKRFKRA